METPLQLSFHNMDADPATDARVRARVEKLERYARTITFCQVFVQAMHTSSGGGVSYEATVEVRMPGADAAVHSRPRGKTRDHQDLPTAINAAFDAIERKLRRRNQRNRQQVKTHDAPLIGRVTELADDHGQIATTDGRLVYFHRNSVTDGAFDTLEEGAPVELVVAAGDKGPQASTVKPIRPQRFVDPSGLAAT